MVINMDGMIEKRKNFIINCLYRALIIAIIYISFKYLLSWIFPFFLGFCFAYAANLIARKIIIKSKISAKFATVTINLLVLAFICGATYFLGYVIFYNIREFIINHFIEGNLLDRIKTSVNNIIQRIPDSMRGFLDDFLRTLPSKMVNPVTQTLSKAVTVSAPAIIVNFFFTIISSFIICADYDNVSKFIKHQLPQKAVNMLSVVSKVLRGSVFLLIKSYSLIILITFSELFIGLSMLNFFGLGDSSREYLLAISAITAIIDIIPVFGTGFILFPWIAISIAGGNYWFALGLFLLYCVIQIVRQIMEPKLVGSSLGLHPALTLMAMFVGVKIIGAIGIFVFPLTLLVLKSLQEHEFIKLYHPLPQTPKTRQFIKMKNTEKKN